MNPVSAAASIAGLVALAGSLVKLATPFVNGIRHAKDDAQSLIDELNALQITLQKVQKFLTSESFNTRSFGDSSLLRSHSTVVTTRLATLYRKVERTSQSIFRTRLVWPIDHKEREEARTQIRTFSQSVHFALSINAVALLSSTSEDIVEVLAKQIEGSKFLNSVEDRITPLERAVKTHTFIIQENYLSGERAGLLNQLADDAQEKHRSRIRKTRVLSTEQSFLEHPHFVQWMDLVEAPQFLWCSGKTGSGKTILSSLTIDQLREEHESDKSAVAFFYFSYAKAQSYSMEYILGSIIRQLLGSQERPIPQEILQSYQNHRDGKLPSWEELHAAFLQTLNEFETVHFVFDAIDEMNVGTRASFLEFTGNLQKLPKVRLLSTSRPHRQGICTVFEICPKINVEAGGDDLRTYIRSQRDTRKFFSLLDEEFKAAIYDRLVQSAQGIFLLPALQLKRVLQEPTRGDIEDSLLDLPSSLAEILDDIIDRILQQTAS